KIDAFFGEKVRRDYYPPGDGVENVRRVVHVDVDDIEATQKGEPVERLDGQVRAVLETLDASLRDLRTGRQIEAGIRQEAEDVQRHLGHHGILGLALDDR